MGGGEARERNGLQILQRPGLPGTALLPRPFAACWNPPPPPYFCFSGGHETLKGHQGWEDTVVNPRVGPEPPSSPSCLHPHPHRPALQPRCRDTCGCSLGPNHKYPPCPGSGTGCRQTAQDSGGPIPRLPGLPITESPPPPGRPLQAASFIPQVRSSLPPCIPT